jgi:hypothetical protein
MTHTPYSSTLTLLVRRVTKYRLNSAPPMLKAYITSEANLKRTLEPGAPSGRVISDKAFQIFNFYERQYNIKLVWITL